MISSISLKNFRSYAQGAFEFENGVNIIVGPNASGKTNLLEAALIICQGKSFRAKDPELVRFQESGYKIISEVSGSERSVTFQLASEQNPKPTKQIKIDGNKYHRLPDTQKLPVVVFEPGHLLMLSGSPELRREYLDTLGSQLIAGFDKTLRNYKRALLQRNSLLKRYAKVGNGGNSDELFVWDLRLSELGGQVANVRQEIIERLNDRIDGLYSDLAQKKSQLYIEYKSPHDSAQYASSLLKKLQADRQLDILRGFTGGGPHREDIEVILNDHPQQVTASRGEARTIVIALKALELSMLSEPGISATKSIKPIVLLDDVFSELDGARRKALTRFLSDYQTFITTTDADLVIDHFQEANKISLQP